MMGVFYSFYAAVLWPCIPMTVPENSVGTAFGIATAIQNFGNSATRWGGKVRDVTKEVMQGGGLIRIFLIGRMWDGQCDMDV